jgi:hypothetical protein
LVIPTGDCPCASLCGSGSSVRDRPWPKDLASKSTAGVGYSWKPQLQSVRRDVMSIRSLFRARPPQCPAYDWKTPVAVLMVIAAYVALYLGAPFGNHRDRNLVGVFALMLLFNYLDGRARWFKWRTWLAVMLHVLCLGWMVFALSYMVYWLCLLYPIHGPGGN